MVNMAQEKNKKKSTNRRLVVQTDLGNFSCNIRSNAPDKGYTVTVPKLKGVVTFGGNLNEVKKMAKEAIELHCESMLKEGLAEVRINSRPSKRRAQVYA